MHAGMTATGQTLGGGWGVAPPQDGSLTVSIDITAPPLQIAPAAYMFEAAVMEDYVDVPGVGSYAAAYLPKFNKPQYLWSTSDAGSFDAPQHLLDAHKRRDTATGQYFGKIFEAIGQHTVTCTVIYPDGRYGSVSQTVTVLDQDTEYSGTETIVVAQDDSFSGAPAHDAANQVNTIAEAFTRFGQLANSKTRILIKRDETHDLSALTRRNLANQSGHLHIDAWGSGSDPIWDLQSPGSETTIRVDNGWGQRQLSFNNLHFRGSWNPVQEIWGGTRLSRLILNRSNAYLVMNRCFEEGFEQTVQSDTPSNLDPMDFSYTFFNEYKKVNFKDFLLLGARENADVSITGCRIVQNTNAANGGENRGVRSYQLYGRNAHSFIRCAARRLYIASNDIFARHGWASNLVYDNQPFRLNRNNVDEMRIILSQNHIEGFLARQVGPIGDGDVFSVNMLFEQNYIIHNPTVPSNMILESGGATIRNNVVVVFDTPKIPGAGGPFEGIIRLIGRNLAPDGLAMPFFIYSNTFINMRSGGNVGRGPILINDEAGYSHVVEQNNIHYVPGQGLASDGPFETDSLPWASRYSGLRLGWDRIRDLDLPADVANGASILVPYWSDYFGTQLTQADFSTSNGRHSVKVIESGQPTIDADALLGEIDVTFEAGGVLVQNNTGATWNNTAALTLHVDRGTPSQMDSRWGHPTTPLSLYRPTGTSGAKTTPLESALTAIIDFEGNLRPGSVHPDATAGVASFGAVEPS